MKHPRRLKQGWLASTGRQVRDTILDSDAGHHPHRV